MSLSLEEINNMPDYEWLLGIRLAQRIKGKLMDLDDNILFFTKSKYDLYLKGIGLFEELDRNNSLFKEVQLSNGDDAYLIIDDIHSKNKLSNLDYDATISKDCELAKLIKRNLYEKTYNREVYLDAIIDVSTNCTNSWIEHSMPNEDRFNDMILKLASNCDKKLFNSVINSDDKLERITKRVLDYIINMVTIEMKDE